MDAQATFSCSFTQSDLGPVAELPSLPRWPAQRLLPQERQDLAVQVLAGAQPVSDLAQEHEVSRKFLYQQAHTAQDASDPCVRPRTDDDEVLFYLPVTKAWLRQLVLGQVLIGHAPTGPSSSNPRSLRRGSSGSVGLRECRGSHPRDRRLD